MGSYQYPAVSTSTWVTPDSYRRVAAPILRDLPSRDYQYLQDVEQSDSYFDDSDPVARYPQESRYGSAFNDPPLPSFLPDLTKSPSVSSGSSIGTPSGRSYQSSSGSYFPPSRKNTGPYPNVNPLFKERDLRYTAIGDFDNGLDQVGSRFADLALEDKYSGRMDASLNENAVYDEYREMPRELTKQERADLVKGEVDDIFDEAEATVTAQDWKLVGPKPGIASSIKQAVRVLRESEGINKDLKGIAATLADYRRKRRHHRPSFSSRKNSTSSKDVGFFGVKDSKPDRDRHRRKW